jgi:hypothetical protein
VYTKLKRDEKYVWIPKPEDRQKLFNSIISLKDREWEQNSVDVIGINEKADNIEDIAYDLWSHDCKHLAPFNSLKHNVNVKFQYDPDYKKKWIYLSKENNDGSMWNLSFETKEGPKVFETIGGITVAMSPNLIPEMEAAIKRLTVRIDIAKKHAQ